MSILAARDIKKLSWGVKVALATNADIKQFDTSSFDFIIPIQPDKLHHGGNLQHRNDKIQRQWMTRLLYMPATPFRLTFALDSNIQPCLDLNEILHQAEAVPFDIATASQSPVSDQPRLHAHNFAVMYKWSPALDQLFRRWILLQTRVGTQLDDQRTLTEAMLSLRSEGLLRVRKIGNAAAAALHYPVWNTWPRESRLLDGPVYLVHWPPGHSGQSLCDLLNPKGEGTRGRRVLQHHAGWNRDFNMTLIWSAGQYARATQGRASFGWDWGVPPLDAVLSCPFGEQPAGWL